jgi:hypothetical protein
MTVLNQHKQHNFHVLTDCEPLKREYLKNLSGRKKLPAKMSDSNSVDENSLLLEEREGLAPKNPIGFAQVISLVLSIVP